MGNEPAGVVVPIPEHLVSSMFEAIESELERACDGTWNDTMRLRVLTAARIWDGFMTKTLTPHQLAEVALQAVRWIEPPWPQAIEDVGNVEKLLAEARELLELRDRAMAAATRERS
jgi:hypothetical protein